MAIGVQTPKTEMKIFFPMSNMPSTLSLPLSLSNTVKQETYNYSRCSISILFKQNSSCVDGTHGSYHFQNMVIFK